MFKKFISPQKICLVMFCTRRQQYQFLKLLVVGESTLQPLDCLNHAGHVTAMDGGYPALFQLRIWLQSLPLIWFFGRAEFSISADSFSLRCSYCLPPHLRFFGLLSLSRPGCPRFRSPQGRSFCLPNSLYFLRFASMAYTHSYLHNVVVGSTLRPQPRSVLVSELTTPY